MNELIADIEKRLNEANSVTEQLDCIEVVRMVTEHLDLYTDELSNFLDEQDEKINNKWSVL